MSVQPTSLFLGNLFNSNYSKGASGIVELSVPTSEGDGNFTSLRGWLAENPVVQLSNIWQPCMPSLDSLTRLSQIMEGTKDTMAWVAGSQSAWAGVNPLEISITFYVFSMNKSSTIRKDVLNLLKLASINTSNGTSGTIHGGYKPKILTDVVEATNYVNNNQKSDSGFVTIRIGNQINLTNMLLVGVSHESSTLEVASKNPLYIKVTAGFKSYRPFTADELQQVMLPN